MWLQQASLNSKAQGCSDSYCLLSFPSGFFCGLSEAFTQKEMLLLLLPVPFRFDRVKVVQL